MLCHTRSPERTSTAQGTTLIVYRLSLGEVEGHGSFTLSPEMVTVGVEGLSSGASDLGGSSGRVYLASGASVVYRFSPLVPELAGDVNRLRLTIEQEGPTSPEQPTVALWNVEREDWEEIPAGWPTAEVDAAPYLLPTGEVRVRVEADPVAALSISAVQMTMLGQR